MRRVERNIFKCVTKKEVLKLEIFCISQDSLEQEGLRQ